LHHARRESGAHRPGGRLERLIGFDPCERPLALQVGGDDPALLADAARDPLGALIAASFLEHHPQAGRPSGGPSLGVCPALQSALGGLWLPLSTEAIPARGSTSARPSR
jgi:hypothetical protein